MNREPDGTLRRGGKSTAMFVYGKDCRTEDLGNGVTRKILAHDGGLMQGEVAFEPGAVGRCTRIRTSSAPTCRRACSN